MIRQPNPFRPGFNQPPAVLAGRDRVIEDFAELLDVAALDHRTPRPMVLVGPRGVGKTVTLGELASIAGQRLSWPAVHVEAKPASFLRDLVTRMSDVARSLEGEAPSTQVGQKRRPRVTGGKISAAGFGVGAELQIADREESVPLAEQLDRVFTQAAQAAIQRDAGIVLTLDELQTADPDDLGNLAAVLQEHVPDDWPLVVVIAALPSLRTTRGSRALPTYLERAEWHDLGPLDPEAALLALTGPAAQAGRPMTRDAAAALIELSGGYPYAIQVAGHFVWRTSAGSDEITAAHAEQARPRIEADLEQLFRSRWEDASPTERDYLVAMAHASTDGAPTSRGVADEMSTTTPKVAYLRDRLIKKGTIYTTGEGTLHFVTPGMAAWLRLRS